jgi:steroid delta-isomerase-like uncharacterized protein
MTKWQTARLSLIASALALSACDKPERTEEERNIIALASQVFTEQLSKGNWELAEKIHAPNFVAHAGSVSIGWQDDIEASKGRRAAFPDLSVKVDDAFADNDHVTIRWTASGTNTGIGMSLPATGKAVGASGITILKVSNGRLVEEWNAMDELTMMRQLGLILRSGEQGAVEAN